MAAIVHPQLAPPWEGGLRLLPPSQGEARGGARGEARGEARPQAPSYALRRLVAAVVVVLVVLAGVSAVRLTAAAVGAVAGPPLPALPVPAPPVAQGAQVVAPGDSYWSIAVSLRPEGDVREVVDALVAANHGRPLQPGDHVLLPLP